ARAELSALDSRVLSPCTRRSAVICAGDSESEMAARSRDEQREFVRVVFPRAPADSQPACDNNVNGLPDSSRASRRARREILKDVRGRLRKGCVPPALLGLVYGAEVPAQPCACLGLLEELLRTLFSRQPPEAIWVGQFAPGTPEVVQAIKRNVCRTVRASLCKGRLSVVLGSAVDRKSPFLRMLHCFPWTRRGRYREGPSTHRQPGGNNIGSKLR
uniref:C2orf72-like C-terminal domain-containing protein n=1 Tax=Scleropages formosus TaxID=113540 RepID=A0A8C9W4M5_SCLFO